MEPNALKKLKRKIFFLFPTALVLIAGLLFLSAGTFKYWQAWVFCGVIFLPAIFVTHYFLGRSPEFLERRLLFREKEARQRTIINLGSVLFFIGLLIPGLDHRYGWSDVPVWMVILSDAVVLAGYFLVFLAFRENPFAARTVEVFEDQRVIDTGPYAVVRHPMYAGAMPMYLFMPLALGSFWAVLIYIPLCAIIIFRTLNEEEVLERDLPGYREYCEKVRYRLVPFVW